MGKKHFLGKSVAKIWVKIRGKSVAKNNYININ